MPMTERYIWSVQYRDGTSLAEYPDPDTHRSFTDVRVDDVALLLLSPNHHLGCTGPVYTVQCGDGVRPIMFRRNAISTLTGEHRRWHVFGWQATVNGRNVKSLAYLDDDDPNGSVILSPHDLEAG